MSLRRLVMPVCVLALAACRSSTPSGLVRLDPEAPGPNCPNGGIKVSTGLDWNHDGELSDDEVGTSRFVCNGADGADGIGTPGPAGDAGVNGLSIVTPEPAGTNCRYGGLRIDVGMDLDGDGTLSASEITGTRYICDRSSVDGIWFGSITVSSADDLAALANVQYITGDLIIETVDGGALTLPELKVVGGRIQSARDPWDAGPSPYLETLRSVSLPALEQAGAVNIWNARALTSLSLPKLARVGELYITYNDALTAMDLSSLARADFIRVWNNPVLPALSLPELAYVNSFDISSNNVLATLTAPRLTFVRDLLAISGNPMLFECAAWRLRTGLSSNADPAVYIAFNDTSVACTAADLCRIVHVTGIGGTLWQCLKRMSFADAQTLCRGIGRDSALAWVTSDAEWLALKSAAASGVVRGGWIGYSDAATEGTWIAVGGFTGYDPTTRADFWTSGAPNGGVDENAAQLLETGLVNDAPESFFMFFLCRSP